MAKKSFNRQKRLPLCVDLDGTLVQSDTLLESVLILLKKQPLSLTLAPFWLLHGKAHTKRKIAERAMPDIALLPYKQDFLAFLREERADGRKLILITGSDEQVAKKVAEHLKIFDDVIGSNGRENRSGKKKAEILSGKYGRGKYEYAGNSMKDFPVWQEAAGAYVVGANERVHRLASRASKVIRTFPMAVSSWSVAHAVRIHQWSKNLLVFIPALFGHKFATGPFLQNSFLAFVALSLLASAVYVTNDLLDLESDRSHTQKRSRPFASGSLSIQFGFALSLVLFVAGIAVATLLPVDFLFIVLLYLAITTTYSFALKQIPILDVLLLACLYVLRVFAGSAATGIEVSQWLLGVSLLLFFSIAVAKRCIELQCQCESNNRGYIRGDIEQLLTIGTVTSVAATPVLMLYVQSDSARLHYNNPTLLWLVVPIFLYWTTRFWFLVRRCQVGEDPVVFALKDRATYIVGAITFCILFLAS